MQVFSGLKIHSMQLKMRRINLTVVYLNPHPILSLPHGVEGGVNSISEGEHEDSMSGGGRVRESVPPTIESRDSMLKDVEGDEKKIALLSVDVSLRVGYAT